MFHRCHVINKGAKGWNYFVVFFTAEGNTTRSVTKLVTSHDRAPEELRNGARDAPQPQQIAVLWKCRTAGEFLHSLRSCHMYHWLRSTLLFHPSKAVLLGYGGLRIDGSGGSAKTVGERALMSTCYTLMQLWRRPPRVNENVLVLSRDCLHHHTITHVFL